MNTPHTNLTAALESTVARARQININEDRLAVLKSLIDYIQSKIDQGQEINLNFICTHNSRRSQFSGGY